MPIFSYFACVGAALTVILLWLGGNDGQPTRTAHTSSQTIGIPKFEPKPELEPARVTTVNFAAEYERPVTKPIKAEDTRRKEKVTTSPLEPWTRNKFAEFPHDNLSIH